MSSHKYYIENHEVPKEAFQAFEEVQRENHRVKRRAQRVLNSRSELEQELETLKESERVNLDFAHSVAEENTILFDENETLKAENEKLNQTLKDWQISIGGDK
jgi:hypothetical protein